MSTQTVTAEQQELHEIRVKSAHNHIGGLSLIERPSSRSWSMGEPAKPMRQPLC
jgi:hypothetical protein